LTAKTAETELRPPGRFERADSGWELSSVILSFVIYGGRCFVSAAVDGIPSWRALLRQRRGWRGGSSVPIQAGNLSSVILSFVIYGGRCFVSAAVDR